MFTIRLGFINFTMYLSVLAVIWEQFCLFVRPIGRAKLQSCREVQSHALGFGTANDFVHVASAWACDIVLPPPDDRPPILLPRPVPGFSTRFHHMEATTTDGAVQVTVRQAFGNEAPYQREGIYLFPAPENAAVS